MTPDELRTIFPRLDPPPGGLRALRDRLERRQRRRLLLPALGVPGLAMAAALALWLIPRDDTRRAQAPSSNDPGLLRLGLIDAPDEAVTVPDRHRSAMAVLRVETGTPGVTFYRVTTLTPPSRS